MEKKRIKKHIYLFLAVLFVFGVLVGCRENRENAFYKDFRVSEMEFTLTDDDIDAFYEKLDECKKIFESADPDRAKELEKNLNKMYELYTAVKIQEDIADALYYCDYSDEKMKDNYLYASSAVNELFNDARGFVKDNAVSKNPLSEVLEEFADQAFNTPVMYRYGDAQTPYNEFMNIRHEYKNLGADAADNYKCQLYNRYLDALNEYAVAYGFPNYYEMAHKTDYFRDYEKRDRTDIRNYVKEYLVPLFREIDRRYENLEVSSSAYSFSTKLLDGNYALLPKNYIYEYLKSLPEDMAKVMNLPFKQDLILIGDKSSSKSTACVDRVGDVHFIYFYESKMDLDTVIHELGHFYADTVGKDHLSFDVCEVHSIANHLLMIKYLENEIEEESYKDFYMYSVNNILYQAVSCAIKDEFEEKVLVRAKYNDFSVEELDGIMSELIDQYGIRDISSRMVDQLMTYWKRLGFEDMGYQLSYTAATVTSLQIYVKSIEDYNDAVMIYKSVCENADEESSFVGTIHDAGLYAPFEKEAYIELEKLIDYYGK